MKKDVNLFNIVNRSFAVVALTVGSIGCASDNPSENRDSWFDYSVGSTVASSTYSVKEFRELVDYSSLDSEHKRKADIFWHKIQSFSPDDVKIYSAVFLMDYSLDPKNMTDEEKRLIKEQYEVEAITAQVFSGH